jgi:hypothetical protein
MRFCGGINGKKLFLILLKKVIKMNITYVKLKEMGYDLSKIDMSVNYDKPISEFITEYRDKTSADNIIELLLYKDFMSEKNFRLYNIWCIRQIQHLIKDKRGIKVINIVEKYTYQKATIDELKTALKIAHASTFGKLPDDRRIYFAISAIVYAVSDIDAIYYAIIIANNVADAHAQHIARISYASNHDAIVARAATDAAELAAVFAAADSAAVFADSAAAINQQIDKLYDYFKTIENNQEYDWSKEND